MSAKEKYQELQTQMAALREQVAIEARAAFEEGSKALFSQYPEIAFFSWAQYTPYFNDGDACEFGVHTSYDSITLGWKTSDDEEGESDDDGVELYDFDDEEYEQKRPVYVAFSKFLEAFEEDDFEAMFGDHAEIVVTPNEVTVEAYEHD